MVDLTKKYLNDQEIPLLQTGMSPYPSSNEEILPPAQIEDQFEPQGEIPNPGDHNFMGPVQPTEIPVTQPQIPTSPLPKSNSDSLRGILDALKASRIKPDTQYLDDMNSELATNKVANEEALMLARQKQDKTNLLNNISKIGGQLNQALSNRAGNTNIKVDPMQFTDNSVDRTTSDAKARTEALMQKFKNLQSKSNIITDADKFNANVDLKGEEFKFNAKEKEAARIASEREKELDRELKRELESGKTLQDKEMSKMRLDEAKDQRKEDITLRKENRKIRGEAEKALNSIDSRIAMINEAKKLAKETVTGPVVGMLPALSKDRQRLEQKLNSLGLTEMVNMFQGMSKAVDSEGERAYFQTTQPNTKMDGEVLQGVLSDIEDKLKGLKDKTKSAISRYDRKGNFLDEEDNSSVSESTGPYGSEVERNGKVYIWDSSTNKYRPRG